jgi:hypothetical protein
MRVSAIAIALVTAIYWVAAQQTDNELNLITQRRRIDLATFPTEANFASLSGWLSTQRADGTWPDVNYVAGCDAREWLTNLAAKPAV